MRTASFFSYSKVLLSLEPLRASYDRSSYNRELCCYYRASSSMLLVVCWSSCILSFSGSLLSRFVLLVSLSPSPLLVFFRYQSSFEFDLFLSQSSPLP